MENANTTQNTGNAVATDSGYHWTVASEKLYPDQFIFMISPYCVIIWRSRSASGSCSRDHLHAAEVSQGPEIRLKNGNLQRSADASRRVSSSYHRWRTRWKRAISTLADGDSETVVAKPSPFFLESPICIGIRRILEWTPDTEFSLQNVDQPNAKSGLPATITLVFHGRCAAQSGHHVCP